MLDNLQTYIEYNNLFTKPDRLLLTVSGGVDSVVMVDMLVKLGYKLGVCHINHNLRGSESHLDEIFVRELAHKYKLDFFVQEINWNDDKRSIQRKSRDIRYSIFEEIRKEHNFQYVLTAHHRDDSLETFFINSLRGTGINGLVGIPNKRDHIRRPLLNISKREIEEYARQNSLEFRVDSSNKKSIYRRNFVRNEIFKLIKKSFPEFKYSLSKTVKNLRKQKLLLDELKHLAVSPVTKKNGKISYAKASFQKLINGKTLLYEVLSNYGFNEADINDLWAAFDKSSGLFHAKNYTLRNSKTDLKIYESAALKSLQNIELTIQEEGEFDIPNGFKLIIEKTYSFKLDSNKEIEYVPAQKLNFPLQVRAWNNTDTFQPIGQNFQTKTIKKYLKDLGLNREERNEALILEDQEKIVCVLGYRLSEHFKLVDKDTEFFKIEYRQSQ